MTRSPWRTKPVPTLGTGQLASLNILEDLGDYPKAYDMDAKAEIARSSTPYYYEGDLARRLRKSRVIATRPSALLGIRPTMIRRVLATRFQWGQIYLVACCALMPE